MPHLLDHLRDYLIAENVVRNPRVAAPGGEPNRPPLWLNPPAVRAPGEPKDATGNQLIERGPDSVIGVHIAPGIASERHEGFIRIDAAEFILRTSSGARAMELEALLQAKLHDKRAWMMSAVRIEESLMFRPLQLLEADTQAFTYLTQYLFERWA